METPGLRSPYVKTCGIYYVARMLDKIRLRASAQLPEEYHPNLGKGFDARVVTFLEMDYISIVERVNQGGTDDEILRWIFVRGRHPRDEEIEIWNEFLRKRGWNDDGTETLIRRKQESGFADRDDVQTSFDYIEADEGRPTGGKAVS